MSVPPSLEARPRPIPWWAVALATVLGNLYLAAGTLTFSVLTLLVAPLRGHWSFRVGRLWARGLLAASLVRLRVEGREALAPGARYVFMANHQSLFDIPALYAAVPDGTRFLGKKSLFQVPIFGWAMRAAGFVAVDRKDLSRAGEMFSAALDRLDAGGSLVLFPEQTRSLDGRLLPFQRGGFLLALKSRLPIVPVGIEGSREVQVRGSFAIRPRAIAVRFGAPIEVAGTGLRRKGELIAEVERRVAELARVEPPLVIEPLAIERGADR